MRTIIRVTGLVAVCAYGQTNVLTWHNDNARTGQNLAETILTTANVKAATFGKLFTLPVDGKVDAQPLYVQSLSISGIHNVLYVATEHGSVYAFDADSGTKLWQVTTLGSGESPSDARNCNQVIPEIGVTGTPVIVPSAGPHGTMYLVGMSKESGGTYHQRLHALDLTTGAEQFGGPVEVTGSISGTGVETAFLPAQHKARPGLLLLNGVVYTSWSSHCDSGPYTGWVFGYDPSTLAKVSTVNVTPNGSDGGIWNSGAGPAADANGNIFLLTGNGTFDSTLTPQGFPVNSDYGNAFVRISTSGTPAVKDYFTMLNTVSESNGDVDLGSGGLMLLPPLAGKNSTTVSLAVGAGKDGNIYVVDQTNLGKFSPTADTIYQQLTSALPGGIWSSPAWFNGTMYYGPVGGTLKAFAFANGVFGSTPSSQSAGTFAYPGTTPSISANGTANAIVWAAENSSPAVLHAYDAANLADELYNSNQALNSRDHFGSGNKYIVPTVVNGKVYVATTNGVGVFGLLPGNGPAVPVLTSPANLATGVATAPVLHWNAASGATSYDVYFGTGSTPAFAATVSGTSYTSGALAPGTSYFWRVVARNNSGTSTSATWSFTTLIPPPSLAAGAGSGFSRTFTFTFNDPTGWQNIAVANVLVNSFLDGRQACYVAFVPSGPSSGSVFLVDDAGSSGGPYSGIALPSSGTAQNSQCSIAGGGSQVSAAGNTVTLTLAITFAPGFSGNKVFYAATNDRTAGSSGWQAVGTWNVPGNPPVGPAVSGMSPARSTASSGVFTFTLTDSKGWQDIAVANILVNSALDGVTACYAAIVPSGAQAGSVFLVDDAGDGGGPFSGMVVPGSGTVANSQCVIGASASSLSGSGNTLTFVLSISFNAGFAGDQVVYVAARSNTATSNWQSVGSITVP